MFVKDCPSCGAASVVTDSRPAKHLGAIRRRRRCPRCGRRWSTLEVLEEDLQPRLSAQDVGDLRGITSTIGRVLRKLGNDAGDC